MAEREDYLRAEPALIARLQAETSVPAHHVLSATELDDVEIVSQPVPALHVLHWDDLPGDTPDDGPAQLVTQQWLVAVVVRNVRGRSGRGAREDAGPLITEVLRALQGHRLGDGFAPLRRVRAPRRSYMQGFFYYHTLWQTQVAT